MADEVGYETHLLTIDEALSRLDNMLQAIMCKAYHLWRQTAKLQSHEDYEGYVARLRAEHAHTTAPPAVAVDTNASHDAGLAQADEIVSEERAAQDGGDWEDAEAF